MREITEKLVVCSCCCSQVNRLWSFLMFGLSLLLALLVVLLFRGGLVFLSWRELLAWMMLFLACAGFLILCAYLALVLGQSLISKLLGLPAPGSFSRHPAKML